MVHAAKLLCKKKKKIQQSITSLNKSNSQQCSLLILSQVVWNDQGKKDSQQMFFGRRFVNKSASKQVKTAGKIPSPPCFKPFASSQCCTVTTPPTLYTIPCVFTRSYIESDHQECQDNEPHLNSLWLLYLLQEGWTSPLISSPLKSTWLNKTSSEKLPFVRSPF